METRPIQETDKLRARFTVWLKTVLQRERINYLLSERRNPHTISLEAIGEGSLVTEPEFSDPDDFVFENEKLQVAFMRLSSSQKNVLVMLFVEGLEPEEAAQKVGCTVQHIYNVRSKALKALRGDLAGGDNDG